MSVPTPGTGDLDQYQPQTWVDVPLNTPAPPGAVTMSAASYNHMEGGISRAHLVAIAAWTLLQAVQELVEDLPTDADLTGLVSQTSLSATLTDLRNGLAAVARTGDYADLTGRPTLPTQASDIGAQPAGAYARLESGVVPDSQLPSRLATAALATAISTAVAAEHNLLVGDSPAALDTIRELAAALGDDPNKIATLTAAIAAKYTKPPTGIPASDLAAGVVPDTSTLLTKTAADATYVQMAQAAQRSAANADHAAAFARIQRLMLSAPAGTFLARTGNDYTFLLGLGAGRYAAWLLPRRSQSLSGVTYTLNCLLGAQIQLPMLSVDDTAATFAGNGTWTNQPTAAVNSPGYQPVPLTVSTTSGSTTITVVSGTITAADSGRRILLPGAGSGGADLSTSIGTVTVGSPTTFTVGSAPQITSGSLAATIFPSYRFNATAGATVTWNTPAATTAVAVGIVTAQNGGLSKVTIDNDATLANLLPTAQQLVTSGRYPSSILVANGGTLNPTDRVLDCYSGSAAVNYDVKRVIADGLSAAAHAVVLTVTGYTPTGGTGSRLFVDRFASSTAATTPLTTGAAMFSALDLSALSPSAWEYAIDCRPAAGGTFTFIGQLAHQLEDQQSLEVALDEAVQTPADGSITACTSAQITRTTKLYHPDSGASLASAPIATSTVVYRLDRNGLTVTPTITWAIDTTVRTAYVMLPLIGAGAVGTRFDRVALEADATIRTMVSPGATTRGPASRSASAWMWDSAGKVAAALYVPDHWGFTDGYPAGLTGSQVEDRAGTDPITKLYFPWAGVNVERLVKAGAVKSYTARYTLAYLPGGADAALATA